MYFLRLLLRIAIRVFFRRVKIENKHLIPKEGPLLVAANHPNTFMDATIIASLLPKQPHFLAGAVFFRTPLVSRILRSLGLIPLARRQDSKDGKVDNNASFKACYEELAKGKMILIFPEGTSIHERKLRKIKTGAARIGLGAAQQYDFKLGIKLLTIGINYSDPRRFRSDLFVHIAPPLELKNWESAYQEDEFAAVRSLTSTVKAQLEEQIILTENEEEDELLHQIEEVYKSRLLRHLGWKEGDAKEDFQVTKGMAEAIHYFKQHSPKEIADLRQDLKVYFHHLKRLQLQDATVENHSERRSFFWTGIQHFIGLLLGFPLYLYGLINNYIPYLLPSKIAYLIAKDEEYIAPIMLYVGMLSFSIFYSLQVYGSYYVLGNGWLTLAYALSLPLTGFFVLRYWHFLLSFKEKWKLFTLFKQKNSLLDSLIEQRAAIVKRLDAARLGV